VIRALALVALAACASAPPEPLPEIARAPHPPDAAPPDAVPHACLPDLASPAITTLDADAFTIRVCFAQDTCYEIDRRSGASLRIDSLAMRAPRVQPDALTIDHGVVDSIGEQAWIANGIASADPGVTLHAEAGKLAGDPPRLTVHYGFGKDQHVRELASGSNEPCAEGTWIDNDVLVTTHDCEGGHVLGSLYDEHGTPIAIVGGAHPIDTVGAFAVVTPRSKAIVAPRAYALVLLLANEQIVVDLVPIQAESTPSPQFAAVSLDSTDWLVASTTGGVGIVDGTRGALAKTWIIPRCAADPTGP
jgi:hypothetical protein